jgi:hypothetical protein
MNPPIAVLNWEQVGHELTSYGPRGVRYGVRLEGDAYVCWAYGPDDPRGTRVGAGITREKAMEVAQRLVEALTEKIARESETRPAA